MLTSSDAAVSLIKALEKHGFGYDKYKIHKLLYYVQGWTLAATGKAAFEESFENWRLGPVATDFRHATKGITCSEFARATTGVEAKSHDPKIDVIINLVVSDLGTLTADELIEKTHAEAPWVLARKGLKEGDPGQEKIDEVEMRRFFSDGRTLGGYTAVDLYLLSAEELQGRLLPMDGDDYLVEMLKQSPRHYHESANLMEPVMRK